MSIIKSIMQQIGLSPDPTKNFTLDASANNGTMKLARGNAGATTQDIMTVNAAGEVNFSIGILGFSYTSNVNGRCLQLPSWLGGLKIQWLTMLIASGTQWTFPVPFTTLVHGVWITVAPAAIPAYVDVAMIVSTGDLTKVNGYVSRYSGSGPAWGAGSSVCSLLAIGV